MKTNTNPSTLRASVMTPLQKGSGFKSNMCRWQITQSVPTSSVLKRFSCLHASLLSLHVITYSTFPPLCCFWPSARWKTPRSNKWSHEKWEWRSVSARRSATRVASLGRIKHLAFVTPHPLYNRPCPRSLHGKSHFHTAQTKTQVLLVLSNNSIA